MISSALAGFALSCTALAGDTPYETTVKLAQEQLTRLGFYSGRIDGDLSGDAQAALARFQLAQNIPASGALDEGTLDALGVKRERDPSDARASTGQASESSGSLSPDSPAETTVKLAQEQLHILGFYSGLIDGDPSNDTQAALAQFQISRNIPASGALDDATLSALGVQPEREPSAAAGGSSPGASPEQKID